MSDIVIVYWSGTGNTEMMANAIGEGIEREAVDVFLKQVEVAGIRDKIAGAFGSYDWGDGEWMQDFVKRLKENGFSVVGDGLIINLTPDEEGLEKCRGYGKRILKEIQKS